MKATGQANKLLHAYDELLKILMEERQKTRFDVLELIKPKVPELAPKSLEDLNKELQEIEIKIEHLAKSFE